MSRPVATLGEIRATRRSVAALGAQIERLTIAVEALRAGQAPQLGRTADACRVLGISRATLWREVKEGRIPCERVGKRGVRFDLVALATAGRVPS